MECRMTSAFASTYYAAAKACEHPDISRATVDALLHQIPPNIPSSLPILARRQIPVLYLAMTAS